MFSLSWINGWANNQDARGLRSHCTHYDITVMILVLSTVLLYCLMFKLKAMHLADRGGFIWMNIIYTFSISRSYDGACTWNLVEDKDNHILHSQNHGCSWSSLLCWQWINFAKYQQISHMGLLGTIHITKQLISPKMCAYCMYCFVLFEDQHQSRSKDHIASILLWSYITQRANMWWIYKT